jgi:hypothetical protein
MTMGCHDSSFIESALYKRVHWNVQDVADCAARAEAAICEAKGLDAGAVPQQALNVARALQNMFKSLDAGKAEQAAGTEEPGAAEVDLPPV